MFTSKDLEEMFRLDLPDYPEAAPDVNDSANRAIKADKVLTSVVLIGLSYPAESIPCRIHIGVLREGSTSPTPPRRPRRPTTRPIAPSRPIRSILPGDNPGANI